MNNDNKLENVDQQISMIDIRTPNGHHAQRDIENSLLASAEEETKHDFDVDNTYVFLKSDAPEEPSPVDSPSMDPSHAEYIEILDEIARKELDGNTQANTEKLLKDLAARNQVDRRAVGRDYKTRLEAERSNRESAQHSILSVEQLATLNNGNDGEKKKSQATELIELSQNCELWSDGNDTGYATIEIGGHKEHHKINSKSFKSWLSSEFYHKFERAASRQSLSDSIQTIEAKSINSQQECKPAIRLAELAGTVYLDLCDPDWRSVEISSSGFRVIQNAPVKFIRRKGMQSLPVPTARTNKGLKLLRKFVNVTDSQEWMLFVGFLMACFKPTGPYPILIVVAEQGSGKSTLSRAVRKVVDPSMVPLRRPPKNDHDLMIMASNSRIVILDNLSSIPTWLSDSLSLLSTGGGFSARELYANDEEVLFNVQCPIVLNGITDFATRADLVDRGVVMFLSRLEDKDRLDEQELWRKFEKAQPYILGSILGAVSEALKNWDKTTLSELPRMADFAKWVTAAEPFLGWEEESFLRIYKGNRQQTAAAGLEASELARVLSQFVQGKATWEGTATQLLYQLDGFVDESTKHKRSWPTDARSLSSQLRRIAPGLRQTGVCVNFEKGKQRIIRINLVQEVTI